MRITQTNTLEDLNKLTRPEFHKLWFIDALTEKQIAKKFGTTKEEVRRKRKELGLNWWNCAVLYISGGPKYKGK
jgi:hypothetical protein